MPQLTRTYCSNCKRSIYNVMIDGVRVPIVLQMIVGQQPDSGPPLAINGPGVKLPSFIRQMLLPHVPMARAELCMNCVSELFGVALVTADEDPTFTIEEAVAVGNEVRAVINDPAIDEVETTAKVMERPLQAIKVGRGARAVRKVSRSKKKAKA